LVDPFFSEGDDSDHQRIIESTPHLAHFEHALPEEPLIFFGSMQTRK
jgi:hypothetical protein